MAGMAPELREASPCGPGVASDLQELMALEPTSETSHSATRSLSKAPKALREALEAPKCWL